MWKELELDGEAGKAWMPNPGWLDGGNDDDEDRLKITHISFNNQAV